MPPIRRRDVLVGTALVIAGESVVQGTIISGHLPEQVGLASPPHPVVTEGWTFFTPAEAAAVEALADRIIPPDPQTPGGKDAGCAVYLDRQLAGAYGHRTGLYTSGPFLKGEKQQGPQSAQGPAETYRAALAALDEHCRTGTDHKPFAQLDAERQDAIVRQLEDGSLQLGDIDVKAFFETLLKDMQEGFFADPIYGGNRDMCAWKMIGFPGARYDYRDWVGRHNEPYPHAPVSIAGRQDWTPHKS